MFSRCSQRSVNNFFLKSVLFLTPSTHIVTSHPGKNLWYTAYDFLWAFHKNYGSILYRFRDTSKYWLKIALFIPLLHLCAKEIIYITIPRGNGCDLLRAVFFTTEPDASPTRRCKKNSAKLPPFTHRSRASQTDKRADRQTDRSQTDGEVISIAERTSRCVKSSYLKPFLSITFTYSNCFCTLLMSSLCKMLINTQISQDCAATYLRRVDRFNFSLVRMQLISECKMY